MAESVEGTAVSDSQARAAGEEPAVEDEVEVGLAPADLELAAEEEPAQEMEAASWVEEGVAPEEEDWVEAAVGSRAAAARSIAVAPQSDTSHRHQTPQMHTSTDSSSRLVQIGRTLHTPRTAVLRSSCCPSRCQSGRISSLDIPRLHSSFANYASR